MTSKTKTLFLRIMSVVGILADIIIGLLGLVLVMNGSAKFADGVTTRIVLLVTAVCLFTIIPIMHLIVNINLFRKKGALGASFKYSFYVLVTIIALGIISLILAIIEKVSTSSAFLFGAIPVLALVQLLILKSKVKDATVNDVADVSGASADATVSSQEIAGEAENTSDSPDSATPASDSTENKDATSAQARKKFFNPAVLAAATFILAALLVVPYAAILGHFYWDYFKDSDEIIARGFKDFSVTTLGGETFTSDDLKGHKLVVVDTWTTWCTWCKVEMPEIADLQREYADKDVYFVGICCDLYADGQVQTDLVEEAKGLCEEYTVEYPTLIPFDENMSALASMITGFPTVYILDEDANIIDVEEGYVADRDWHGIIDSYLQ